MNPFFSNMFYISDSKRWALNESSFPFQMHLSKKYNPLLPTHHVCVKGVNSKGNVRRQFKWGKGEINKPNMWMNIWAPSLWSPLLLPGGVNCSWPTNNSLQSIVASLELHVNNFYNMACIPCAAPKNIHFPREGGEITCKELYTYYYCCAPCSCLVGLMISNVLSSPPPKKKSLLVNYTCFYKANYHSLTA